MPTVSAFIRELSLQTRPAKAAHWDPVGLQVGDPDAGVARVAVCHELTEALTDRVEEVRPDLVVAYHPLLFRPTTRLVTGATPGGRAYRLARAGIGLFVCHTDFDAAPGGTADALAAALDLSEAAPFGPVEGRDQVKVVTFAPEGSVEELMEAMGRAGAGRIGNYDACSFRTPGTGSFRAGAGTSPVTGVAGQMNLEAEVRLEMVAPRSAEAAVVASLMAAHPYEEPAYDVYDVRSGLGFIGRIGRWEGKLADLVSRVADKLGAHGLRVAGQPDVVLERVAVVPGSGSSFIDAAAGMGAGAIVTGDVDHHRAVAAVDGGVAVIDPGHAATELPGMRRLLELVASLGVEVIDLTGDGTGPWLSGEDLP